ncbi:SurA N-terminal domain-containing protein [Alkalimarinus alittae]|uniref:Periplasmic chaperone PpiD n=1 Tax=Alkalimarinus alittae TaxID=2961619 RepID=A0ABY6MXV9_9ALTE|nr:SurA N-terminal domain-containing protein [Alkalimarinus alittae]UZE94666.1 SurA N-terminal domain-containing protein [Alkalimarinus alittae]
MLQDIRDNAQSTVAKVIVGLIVLTFALFGVDSIVGGFGGEPEVAVVNGNDIKETDFLRAVDIKKRQILGQMGEDADPALIDDQKLKQSVLEGLIDQEILLQDAIGLGVYISDQSINSLITGINQFKVDGQFDNDLFLASIRNFGMTTQTFKESIKKEVLISQPRNAIISTSFILDDEFNRVIEIDRQTRNYSLAKFDQSDYIDAVNVDENEIEAFYESHKQDYATIESVDVEYLQLEKNALLEKVEVTQEELQKAFEREVEAFEGLEERNASHILIEINDDVSDAQAKALAEKLSARIAEGESFEALAKEFSDDIGSAAQGGSLGFASKGAYLPAFDDALFALSEGSVSKPVLTEYGYHLIKLEDVQMQPIPTFEEMRFSIEADIKAEKVEALYVELSERLADLSYASSDLREPADELGLDINTAEKVSALSIEGLFGNPKVQKSLFSADVIKDGNNSELIEINSEAVVVVRAANHYPASQKGLSEVRDEIVAELKRKKATDEAISAANKATEAYLSGNEDTAGLAWESFKDIKRNDFEVNPELIKFIFSMPAATDADKSVSGIDIDGDYFVVKLDSVNVPNVDDVKAAERQAIRRVIGGGLGNAEYQVFQTALRAKAEIEKI